MINILYSILTSSPSGWCIFHLVGWRCGWGAGWCPSPALVPHPQCCRCTLEVYSSPAGWCPKDINVKDTFTLPLTYKKIKLLFSLNSIYCIVQYSIVYIHTRSNE